MTTLLAAWAVVAVVLAHLVRLVAAMLAAGRRPERYRPGRPGRVAIVRPIRGVDADAREHHASLLCQEPAPAQVLFVATDVNDPGLAAARQACRRSLVAGEVIGSDGVEALSDKARNMIAGWHASEAPFVAFCDSDLTLAPDDVDRCLALFDAADVGAVFAPCLFDAEESAGRVAMLMATVDASVLVAAADRLGQVPFMQGGLMVVRRRALERAGGIERLADAVADDLRLAHLLREAGYRVRVTARPVVHHTPPEGLRTWLERYHRWMVCHRAEGPLGFWLMLLMNPVVVPLIAWLAGAVSPVLLVGSIALELLYTMWVDRTMLRPHGVRLGLWACARPIADLIHAAACVAALLLPLVRWRGRTYRLGAGRRIVAVNG